MEHFKRQAKAAGWDDHRLLLALQKYIEEKGLLFDVNAFVHDEIIDDKFEREMREERNTYPE